MHSQLLSLSENGQIIDPLGKISSFESEAVDLLLEELRLHFRPSILAYPVQIGLKTVNKLFVPQKAVSYGVLLQRVLVG